MKKIKELMDLSGRSAFITGGAMVTMLALVLYGGRLRWWNSSSAGV
jgi:hypothetical protein